MSLPLSSTCTTETLPMCSLPVLRDPVLQPATEAQQLNPTATALEHILANLACFETRLDNQDRRITAQIPPSKLPPDPPYGYSQFQSTDSGIPRINPTAAVGVSIPSLSTCSASQLFVGSSTQPWRYQGQHQEQINFPSRPHRVFDPRPAFSPRYHTMGASKGFPKIGRDFSSLVRRLRRTCQVLARSARFHTIVR